jgi:hypothetical protein
MVGDAIHLIQLFSRACDPITTTSSTTCAIYFLLLYRLQKMIFVFC